MKKEHIVIPCIAIGGDDGEVEIIKNGGPKFGALLQGIKKSLSEARKEAVKKAILMKWHYWICYLELMNNFLKTKSRLLNFSKWLFIS